MNNSSSADLYIGQLETLKSIVKESDSMLINEVPFVTNNINFYTKSFFIMSCIYLEAYLKDILIKLADEINQRLLEAKLPHNYIRWRLLPDKEFKDLETKCNSLQASISRKDLDEYISGNPYRTIQLFLKFGINLKSYDSYNITIDKIQSIVTKRNNITHHNDDASDISNSDLVNNIDFLIEYIKILDGIIAENIIGS